jgi:hypothetical protein
MIVTPGAKPFASRRNTPVDFTGMGTVSGISIVVARR